MVAAMAGVLGSWAIAWWGTRIRVPDYPCANYAARVATASSRAWNHAGTYMHAAIWVSLVAGVGMPLVGGFVVRRDGEWDRERLWLVALLALVATGALWLVEDRILHRPQCEGL